MMNSKIYTLAVIIATIIGLLFLPWWYTPILIMIAAFFHKEGPLSSAAIATGLTTTIWVGFAIFKDTLSLGKISEVTGSILMGLSKSTLLMITGLVISIVSGMMASVGGQLKGIFSNRN
jgi:ABC-type polysaccharide transport system permease subunit